MDGGHVYLPAIGVEILDLIRYGRSVWVVASIDDQYLYLRRGKRKRKIYKVGAVKWLGRGAMVADFAATVLHERLKKRS